jgi:hypothetical protein
MRSEKERLTDLLREAEAKEAEVEKEEEGGKKEEKKVWRRRSGR